MIIGGVLFTQHAAELQLLEPSVHFGLELLPQINPCGDAMSRFGSLT